MNFTMRNAMTNLMKHIKDNNIKPYIVKHGYAEDIKSFVFTLSDDIAVEFNYSAVSECGFIFLCLRPVTECEIQLGTYTQADVPFEEADFCTQKEIYDFVMSYDDC